MEQPSSEHPYRSTTTKDRDAVITTLLYQVRTMRIGLVAIVLAALVGCIFRAWQIFPRNGNCEQVPRTRKAGDGNLNEYLVRNPNVGQFFSLRNDPLNPFPGPDQQPQEIAFHNFPLPAAPCEGRVTVTYQRSEFRLPLSYERAHYGSYRFLIWHRSDGSNFLCVERWEDAPFGSRGGLCSATCGRHMELDTFADLMDGSSYTPPESDD